MKSVMLNYGTKQEKSPKDLVRARMYQTLENRRMLPYISIRIYSNIIESDTNGLNHRWT